MSGVSESEVFDALEESYLLNGGGDDFEYWCTDTGRLSGEVIDGSSVRVEKFTVVHGVSDEEIQDAMMGGLALFLREYGLVGGDVVFEIPIWGEVSSDCEMMEFLREYGFEYRGSAGRPDAEVVLVARGKCGVGGWLE